MDRIASLRRATAAPRRGRWVRPLLLATLIFGVVVTLFCFFGVPPLAKSHLQQRLTALLGRKVTVETVRFNPFTLGLTLENFAIRDRDGTAPFLGWRQLYVNFDAIASLQGEWVLGEIALDGFDARVAINPDESLSFADILARVAPPGAATTPSSPSSTRPVRIGSLKVAGARVAFADHARAKPFATTLGPLTFTVTEFRTVSRGAPGAPYRFEAVTEAGEKFAWSGTFSADPLRSSGEFRLENLLLPKYAPYYAAQVNADLASGQASVRGHYDLDLTKGQQVIRLRDGAVQVRELKLLERATQESAVELASLDLAGLQADALTLKAKADSLTLRGGKLRARREKDGTINLLAMVPAPAPTTAPATPSTAPAPTAPPATPEFTLGQLALQEFQIAITDLAAPRPAQLSLDQLQVSVRDVSLAEGATLPVQLSFNWAPKGTVELSGNVSLNPIKAELKTEVAGLDLLPLSPYLEQFVNARLTQGTIIANLNTTLALPANQPPAITTTGDIALNQFGLVDSVHNEELAGFQALQLWGLRASTAPELSIALEEITVAGPFARLLVHPDGKLNVGSLARTPPAPAATPAATPVVSLPSATPAGQTTAPASSLPQIEIGRVVIKDGDYRFTDRSLTPIVTTAINQFGGTIAGLSSRNLAKADVDLKARVDGSGPISIAGKLDALGPKPFVDLKVNFANVDLLPLSPYAGKYAGYQLARGKLLLDVKVVVDGPKIDATNVITLQQFTFGQPVQSPDATKLPVRLGVALLKDLDGKIVIDVPIQGRTDDPSFGIGRVVLRVITNLLTKAAVSPFSLLGAAFGGGSDELAFQDFAPGSFELQAGELKKLQTMVQALTNRPGLNLDLRGSYDEAADAHALKRVKLAELIRRSAWETKRLADPNLPPPDQLVLTPEERVAALKSLFDAKFPPGTQFGTPLPQPPTPVAPPPPPEGWLARVMRTFTRESQREAQATAAENARLKAEHDKAVAAALAVGRPLDEMTERLAETITIGPDDLRALAQARAQQVRTYFTETGKIAPDRLFLASDQTSAGTDTKGPRVFLSLQ